MKNKNDFPLKCEQIRGAIHIMIGKNVLKFAAENHPILYGDDNINIIDIDVFFNEIINEINHEAEDGSTMLTNMLDAAILTTVNNGCEGIQY